MERTREAVAIAHGCYVAIVDSATKEVVTLATVRAPDVVGWLRAAARDYTIVGLPAAIETARRRAAARENLLLTGLFESPCIDGRAAYDAPIKWRQPWAES